MPIIKAVVQTLRWQTPTIIDLTLVPRNGGQFPSYTAGQFSSLSFPDHRQLRSPRPFSIASSPLDRSQLRFGIRVQGNFTRHLVGLRIGDRAEVAGPAGVMTFNPDRDRRAVYLAGGIGITPFMGVFSMAAAQKLANELTLLFSNRSLAETPYQAELEQMMKQNPNFRVVYAVSNEKIVPSEKMANGQITAALLQSAMNNNLGDASYFLCGPPAFMKAMTKILARLSVPVAAIHTEAFSIMPPTFFEPGPIPKLALAGWAVMTAGFVGLVTRIEQHKRSAIVVESPAVLMNNSPVNTNSTPTVVKNVTNQNSAAATTNTTPTPKVIPAPVPVQPTNPPFIPRTRAS